MLMVIMTIRLCYLCLRALGQEFINGDGEQNIELRTPLTDLKTPNTIDDITYLIFSCIIHAELDKEHLTRRFALDT